VDERVSGDISVSGGAHGVGLKVDAADLIAALGAQVADVSEPQ
jgi:prolyl-tRNA editing enzyme YbaK/EbsC (Cys-tRNA(Pro) deacylase)